MCRMGPAAGTERVALLKAAGRTLAEAIKAERPVPAHTNAAVDGYSFRAADYDRANGSELGGAGRAAAGRALGGARTAKKAVRIFTGAVMPEGHDTVVMQEDVGLRVEGEQSLVVI